MGASVNIPNLLSIFRIVAAPAMLYLAWQQLPDYYLMLLGISLGTDAIDGWLARKLRQETILGARLDSWGDLATYMTVPFCAWWLWPEMLKQEAIFVLLTLAAYLLPLFAGLIKFRKIPSYHTWGAKFQAVFMSSALFILFLFELPWPFRVAAITQALVATEEIAITLYLAKLQSNIPSFWHLVQRKLAK